MWLPATGTSDEELAELIEEARERILRGEPPVEPPLLRPRPRERRLPSLLEGLAVVAFAAVMLFVLLPDRGWSGLSSADQQRTERLLSQEAAEIAGHEVDVRCDASGQAVGIVQHADGVAEVGGRRALLDARDLLPPAPAPLRGRRRARSARPHVRSPSSPTRRGTCTASATRA